MNPECLVVSHVKKAANTIPQVIQSLHKLRGETMARSFVLIAETVLRDTTLVVLRGLAIWRVGAV